MAFKLFFAILCFLLLFSFLFVGCVGASSEMWSQTYGGPKGDYARSLVETFDGGYALVGISRDGYGFNIDCLLVKTDAYGNMEWNQTYRGEDSYQGDALVQTSDEGFIIAGDRYNNEGYDSWVAKTDAYGNMEWNKTYGGPRPSIEHFNSIVETSDGGFAAAGYTTFRAGDNDFWLVKMDVYGNVAWNQTYDGMGEDFAVSLVVTIDGGYALAGGTQLSSWSERDFWLVKTDEFGNMEWNRTYGGDGNDFARSLVATSDGGYALAGGKDGNVYGGGDFWLVKTDEYGIMEWNRTYKEFSALSLVEASNGGYAIAGGNGLVKTDAYGNIEWNRTYNGEWISSLIETSDGGYALAGYSGSFDIAGKTDFWLAKADEHGVIPEFPSWTILPLLIAATLVGVIIRNKIRKNGLE
jgi:hypothetical protein